MNNVLFIIIYKYHIEQFLLNNLFYYQHIIFIQPVIDKFSLIVSTKNFNHCSVYDRAIAGISDFIFELIHVNLKEPKMFYIEFMNGLCRRIHKP